MTTLDSVPDLSERQRVLLTSWLPGAVVVRDHSWGLVERTLLEVEHEEQGHRMIADALAP